MKAFAVCYGFRDQLCVVQAENEEEARKKVIDHLLTFVSQTSPEMNAAQVEDYVNDLAVEVSGEPLESIMCIDV
jgi:hypothetical protein